MSFWTEFLPFSLLPHGRRVKQCSLQKQHLICRCSFSQKCQSLISVLNRAAPPQYLYSTSFSYQQAKLPFSQHLKKEKSAPSPKPWATTLRHSLPFQSLTVLSPDFNFSSCPQIPSCSLSPDLIAMDQALYGTEKSMDRSHFSPHSYNKTVKLNVFLVT